MMTRATMRMKRNITTMRITITTISTVTIRRCKPGVCSQCSHMYSILTVLLTTHALKTLLFSIYTSIAINTQHTPQYTSALCRPSTLTFFSCTVSVVVSDRSYPRTEVFPTSVCGFGLKLLESVGPGRVLIEYTGEVISSTDCNSRMAGPNTTHPYDLL